MERARSAGKIVPFPGPERWAAIARGYVDHMTQGDPRAAFYYLEYELSGAGLSRPPPALAVAIEREYARRGFRGPVRFDGSG
jgi:hypothetical protein